MADLNACCEVVRLRDLRGLQSVRQNASGILYAVHIINTLGIAIFVQLFDVATLTGVTLGSTVPDHEFWVQPNSDTWPPLPPVGGAKIRAGLQLAATTNEGGSAVNPSVGVQVWVYLI